MVDHALLLEHEFSKFCVTFGVIVSAYAVCHRILSLMTWDSRRFGMFTEENAALLFLIDVERQRMVKKKGD